MTLEAGTPLSIGFTASDSNTNETPVYLLDNENMTCDDGGWSPTPTINTLTGAISGTPMGEDIGTCTIRVKAISGEDTISHEVEITTSASSNQVTAVNLTAPSVVIANTCTSINAQAWDLAGIPALLDANETITMAVNNGTGSFYSDDTCSTAITTTTILTGSYETNLYFQSATAPQELTLIATSPSYNNGSASIKVGSSATTLLVEAPPQVIQNNCESITISRIDSNGNKIPEASVVNINLTQSDNLKFYSNSSCSSEITSTAIAQSHAEKSLWIMATNATTVTIGATDQDTNLTPDSTNVEIVASLTWWNNSWPKRMVIQIDNLDQATTFSNQVVLVQLNSGRINYSDLMVNGNDLRFLASDHTTVLEHEIDVWNTSGTSMIWVKVPTIQASSGENYIYLYYGNNSAIDGQDVNNVWSNFYSVWHLQEDPTTTAPQFTDSAVTGNHGIAENSPTSTQAIFGNGIDMSGDNDVIDVGTDLSAALGYSSTFSVWLKTNQVGNNTSWRAPGITGVEGAGNSNDIFFGWIDASGYLGVTAGNGAAAKSNFVVNDNVWRHITVTRNHTNGAVQFFVNGVLNGSGNSESGAKTLPFSKLGIIGDTGGTPEEFDGSLEEVRIYSSVQSADQIKADYKYMTESPFTYGSPESL